MANIPPDGTEFAIPNLENNGAPEGGVVVRLNSGVEE